ncbi:hypothetical protein PFICI_04353 [Pestalotiopsis fici W106-1]|uniref:Uncharacterized protein n=1 Tax=Pestalotiopsis fici (strain W106-1 / CGMCC3.15140) TaxID=1229662 RepID=W3XAM7_PESFW|nr:uncharacterized protein PFICI_04353 [Pestalotiopsis fici W106-1]ETS82477.1 hypothetical protein PFICI_04353 [Pestalotiopsis fici W106-1]
MQYAGAAYAPIETARNSSHDEVLLKSIPQATNEITEPPSRPTRKLGHFQYWLPGIQISLTVFPILFIALAATAITLDKQPISRTGDTAQYAIALAPTIFPIVFAAIVGKFFRVLGLYLAERGTKLGTLERLIGSHSLFAVVEKQLVLPGQYLLGLGMILLWALSPVGGQLALRLLQTSPRVTSDNSTIRYLPISACLETPMEGGPSANNAWPLYGPLFMSSLIASRSLENPKQDMYGNVRVPQLDRLMTGDTVDNDTWVVVNSTEETPWSSLLGVPVAGVPKTGNLSFNLVSRYYAIDCDAAVHVENSTIFSNTSSGLGAGYYMWDASSTFAVQSPAGSELLQLWNGTRFIFNITSANDYTGSDVSFTTCSLSPRDVDSSVLCNDGSCQVTAMRNMTVDLPLWWSQYFSPFLISLHDLPLVTIGAMHQGSKISSTLTEMWIQDPHAVYDPEKDQKFANFSMLSKETISQNMEILFNTYWQSICGSRYLFGGLSTNMSLYDNIFSYYEGSVVVDFNTSQVTITTPDGDEYSCNMTFATLLIIISCILLLVSLASFTLGTMTLAPDILGYISSLTRDNPFIPGNEASHQHGLERAKALNNMKVIVGDVDAGAQSGYIAFTKKTANMQRLRRERFYR